MRSHGAYIDCIDHDRLFPTSGPQTANARRSKSARVRRMAAARVGAERTRWSGAVVDAGRPARTTLQYSMRLSNERDFWGIRRMNNRWQHM